MLNQLKIMSLELYLLNGQSYTTMSTIHTYKMMNVVATVHKVSYNLIELFERLFVEYVDRLMHTMRAIYVCDFKNLCNFIGNAGVAYAYTVEMMENAACLGSFFF